LVEINRTAACTAINVLKANVFGDGSVLKFELIGYFFVLIFGQRLFRLVLVGAGIRLCVRDKKSQCLLGGRLARRIG
jgi:hypothetical protein